MAKLPSSFKRKDYGKMRDFKAIPKGEYIAKITASDYKANSKKTGHFLALTLEVQNKEHKGHKLFANLNLDNPNETTVQIANDEFATILDACSKKTVKDSKELHNILMIVTLGIDKDDKNVIKMYDLMGEEKDEDEDSVEDDEDKNEDSDSDDEDKDDDDDDDDAITTEQVVALAKKFKELTDGKTMKKVIKEYDIKKIAEIKDLDEDDLESLKEDLEEEIEDAE